MARSVLAGSSDGGGKRRLLTDWWCPHSLSLRSTLRLIRLDCPQRPTLLLATTLGPLGWGWGFTGTGRDNRFVSETFYPGNITVLYFHILCSTAEQSISTENFVQNKISFIRKTKRSQYWNYLLGNIAVGSYVLYNCTAVQSLSYLISYISPQTYLRFRGLIRGTAASPANHEAAGQPTNRKPRRLGWAWLAWVITQAVERSWAWCAPPSFNTNICSAQTEIFTSPSPVREQREIWDEKTPSRPIISAGLKLLPTKFDMKSKSINTKCREIIDFDNYLSLPARTSHISSLQTLHEAKF